MGKNPLSSGQKNGARVTVVLTGVIVVDSVTIIHEPLKHNYIRVIFSDQSSIRLILLMVVVVPE